MLRDLAVGGAADVDERDSHGGAGGWYPMNGPQWVPRPRTRAQTLSPKATISSIVQVRDEPLYAVSIGQLYPSVMLHEVR
jgi:hypothetical protein